ncbi:MAG: CCA tRNA nucleotidyltransferase, partial [Acidimicrobiales bacterium]
MIPARLQPILDETRPLAERFAADGKRIYLVGGIVRDLLLGDVDLHGDAEVDIDLTTDARPKDTKRLLAGWADAVWTQGERFGTIGCQKDGRQFEITTHRAEVYLEDSRKPDVVYSDAIESDLSRRDFTINAMALALPEPELIDPFGGAADLAAKVLRTPLDPHESFSDDPLRMMRAARFIAKYGVEPDPAMVAAVVEMRDRLEIVSAERIRDELDKLLVVEDPSPGLWFLVDTGLVDEFLPELPAMRLEQDPIHRHKDVLAHTIAVVAKTRPERIVRLAALLHDVGKPKTRSIGDAGVSFHHHEVVGARMARDRMRALKYSNDDVDVVSRLVYLHLRFHTYQMGWTDSAVRRFVRDAGPLLSELIELTRCDCTTRNERKAKALARRMDELEERIAELQAHEELKSIRPDLDGNQVM